MPSCMGVLVAIMSSFNQPPDAVRVQECRTNNSAAHRPPASTSSVAFISSQLPARIVDRT